MEGIGINFNTTPPTLTTTAVNPDLWAHLVFPSAVSDADGNLLFYCEGNAVFDRNHQMMPNGNDAFIVINDPATGSPYTKGGSIVIIPQPGNSTRYYVFAATSYRYVNNGASAFEGVQKYFVVDMSLNNGMGDVVQGEKNMLLSTEKVSAMIVAAGNGSCKKWVLYTRNFSGELLAYELSASGISNTPVVSTLHHGEHMEIDISNNNEKLALHSYVWQSTTSATGYVHLYDFDVNTGKATPVIAIDTYDMSKEFVRGMVFSHDNSKFYTNEVTQPTIHSGLWQYDLNAPTLQDIIRSKTYLHNDSNNTLPWDPVLAPDGKIYKSLDSGRFLIVNHSDRKGTAADCKVITLQGPWNYKSVPGYGLHNYVPVSKTMYSYADFNTCTLPVQLSSRKSNAYHYEWSTGANTQQITATQNGTYWVRAEDGCGGVRIDTFHVDFSPPQPLNDTFACNGQTIVMPEQAGLQYTWHDGRTITKTGTYSVTIKKDDCGTVKDDFFVRIYPEPGSLILDNDTLICNERMRAEISCLYDMGNYLWNTGDTMRSIVIDRPGKYWLKSTTPCGVFSDTVYVSFCKPYIEELVYDDTICSGSCITLRAKTGNYPQDSTWLIWHRNGNLAQTLSFENITLCYDDTGTFKISLTVSSAGGTDTMHGLLHVLPKPRPYFSDSSTTVPYKTILLLPMCGEASTADWYKNDSLICNNCPSLKVDARDIIAGYTCVLKNAECYDTCNYTIHVTDIPTDAWLPSAFSPNGDGRNDRFRIVSDNPNINIKDFSVFNRFGQIVYRSTNANDDGWDGNFKGSPAEVSTYFWQLTYRVAGNNRDFYLKGDVIMVR